MDMKLNSSTNQVSYHTRKAYNNYWVELCPLMSPSELENLKEKETGKVTLLNIIKTCGDHRDIRRGMLFHHYVINTLTMANIFIENTLIAMYSKCGYIEDARQLFDRMQNRNVASWTAMMAGYGKMGYSKEAIQLHCQMELEGIKSNEVTYVSLLQACMELSALKLGVQAHVQILHVGLQKVLEVSNSLVSMYSKCGWMEEACSAFNQITTRDVISWNSLIAGYVHHGNDEDALRVYDNMQMQGHKPDKITYLSILNACGNLAAVELGKSLHCQMVLLGLDSELEVENTIINMYAKCGCMSVASYMFKRLPNCNVVTWSVMTAAYAQHGSGYEAIRMTENMQLNGFKLDYITFVSLLTACSHSGLIERGYHTLHSMEQEYCTPAAEEHYACMVDLLGRAGCLQEVEVLIQRIPVCPSLNLWRAILGACKIHGNVVLAKLAVQRILDLEPEDTAASIMLSNIHLQLVRTFHEDSN